MDEQKCLASLLKDVRSQLGGVVTLCYWENQHRSIVMWIVLFIFWVHAAMATPWQQPPAEVLDVLHAPPNPGLWISPDASHAVEVRRVMYPPLADKASGMKPLAGIRVDTRNTGRHGAADL